MTDGLEWLDEAPGHDEAPDADETVDRSVVEETGLTPLEQQLISDMADTVAQHEVRLEALESRAEEVKTPRGWVERNGAVAEWEDLATWVDWLNANYSMPDESRVPPCWPEHRGLVHVLAGLRSAWRAAVVADEQAEETGNAMAAFHDYHLFPFFQRLSGQVTWFPCVRSTHTPDVEHAPTNRGMFPPGLTEPETEPKETHDEQR